MLSRIPKTEAERIEGEVKREESKEFAEMKKNIWRKWRGKNKVIENKTKLTDNEKVDKRMEDITRKLDEYSRRKEELLKKRDMKKRLWKEQHKMIVEDH